MIHTQVAKIGIRLSATYKQDRLSRHVRHGKCSSDLVILGVSAAFHLVEIENSGWRRWRRSMIMGKDDSGDSGGLTMVSNFVNMIPSIPLFLCAPPIPALEKSFKARSNFVNWSTASFPTSASPTNKILSGLFTVTSYYCQRQSLGLVFVGARDEDEMGYDGVMGWSGEEDLM